MNETENVTKPFRQSRIRAIAGICLFAGLILAVAFLIATIVLFFVLKIPKALGVVTGRTQKRAGAGSGRGSG